MEKRSKTSSSSDASTTRSSILSLKLTNEDDLLDSLLVEVLCRLPSYKIVHQCKCVSKRWSNLISDSYFIGRFVRVQIDKQPSAQGSLISEKGEEFLNRISSSGMPLARVFDKLVSLYSLKKELHVVGAYNDLVLCCSNEYDDQPNYFICNPYTTEWVALPLPPEADVCLSVGIICDLPYYSCNDEGNVIRLNDWYRCRVVRIVEPFDDELRTKTKFRLQIFAFVTGSWKELIVPAECDLNRINYFSSGIGFAYNGKLYWDECSADRSKSLIELDPFTINDTDASTDIVDGYNCCLIRLGGQEVGDICFGVYGRQLRTCYLEYVNYPFHNILVCDLNKKDEVVKLPLQHIKRVCPLNESMISRLETPDDVFWIELLGSDPCNEDILYLCNNKEIVECNIVTKELSKISEKRDNDGPYLPIALPWWPTPVPTLRVADPQ